MVWSVEHFKNYLLGRIFVVRTDHQALLSALQSNRGNKTSFSRLARWVDRLLPFTFEVQHIPGQDMGWADYFSRHPGAPAPPISEYDQNFSVSVISKLRPFVNTLKAHWHQNGTRTGNCTQHINVVQPPHQSYSICVQSHACNLIPHCCTSRVVSVCPTQLKSRPLNRNLHNDIISNSPSTISPIPPDYDSPFPSLPATPTEFETVPSHLSSQPPQSTLAAPPIAGSPMVDPELLQTLLAAVRSDSRNTTTVGTSTDSDRAVDQFSTELLIQLTAQDVFFKKVKKALPARRRIGKHWVLIGPNYGATYTLQTTVASSLIIVSSCQSLCGAPFYSSSNLRTPGHVP